MAYKSVLPRDLQPGMKVARLNRDLDIEYVEVDSTVPILSGGKIQAYKVYLTPWRKDQAVIAADARRKHLAPFIVPVRAKVEVLADVEPQAAPITDDTLVKATDRAIAEVNQAFLDSPEAQERASRDGDRWRHILDAERAAGPHAAVLPVKLAEDILHTLKGDGQSVLALNTLVIMFQDSVERAAQRPEQEV